MEPENDRLMELMQGRTSCRAYSEREVDAADINYCLEAVRCAPSACNRQPWRFIIVRDSDTRSEICRHGLLPCLPMPWLKSAPVIVVLCACEELLTHKVAPMISGIDYQLLDCGIAGEHFVLAAESRGLGSCWIGWFKPKFIRKLLKLPGNFRPVSLISIGHPLEPRPPSTRRPLDEIARFERWK